MFAFKFNKKWKGKKSCGAYVHASKKLKTYYLNM